MTEDEEKQRKLFRLLRDIERIELDSPAEALGIVSYLVGAVHSLLEAIGLGYAPRGSATGAHRDELRSVIKSMIAKKDAELSREWLARQRFNSALHRLASVTDRLIAARWPELAGQQKMVERSKKREREFAPGSPVGKVWETVNKLKHDRHGGTATDTLPAEIAIKAVDSLARRAKAWLKYLREQAAQRAAKEIEARDSLRNAEACSVEEAESDG